MCDPQYCLDLYIVSNVVLVSYCISAIGCVSCLFFTLILFVGMTFADTRYVLYVLRVNKCHYICPGVTASDNYTDDANRRIHADSHICPYADTQFS